MSILKERIETIAEEFFADTVAWRRHLHQNPELSFEEHETAMFVEQRLESLGIPYERMAGTGDVGTIRGELGDGKVLALRADMNALAIHRAEGRRYGPRRAGVTHASGPDDHTSPLNGVAPSL